MEQKTVRRKPLNKVMWEANEAVHNGQDRLQVILDTMSHNMYKTTLRVHAGNRAMTLFVHITEQARLCVEVEGDEEPAMRDLIAEVLSGHLTAI